MTAQSRRNFFSKLRNTFLGTERRRRRTKAPRLSIEQLEYRLLLAADLVPYVPPTWSDAIVVSTQSGTNTDATRYEIGDYQYYIDVAWENVGDAAAGPFDSELTVPLGARLTLNTLNLPAGVKVLFSENQFRGFLPGGLHDFSIDVDSGNDITENDDTNNNYTRDINVELPSDAKPLILGTGDVLAATTTWVTTDPEGITANDVSDVFSFTLASASGVFLDID